MRLKSGSDPSLRFFFDERACQIGPNPDWQQLCFASGKEPRLWTQPALYDDMMESIRAQLDLRREHSLLEVGCAAGFLAKGLCRMCQRYVGIDLAPRAIERARSLRLANASFQVADAAALPFENGSFDRVICYDVFTNFPDMGPVKQIVTDSLRVAGAGAKMLVGSLPDQAREREYPGRVREVNESLDRDYGPLPPAPKERLGSITRMKHWWLRSIRGIEPRITCYYFRRADFLSFGSSLGVETRIEEVHRLSPYRGFRFNVIYSKVGN
jgi:SAM-dependent methyltransferase